LYASCPEKDCGVKSNVLSAGLVVVRETQEARRYLLLRAYNYWDFTKGVVETGEDPMQTALREAEEETSLESFSFPWGEVFRETAQYGRGKVARYYIAQTCQAQITLPVSAELGRPEHHEYRWLSYEEARALLVPRLIPILDWAHEVTAVKLI
jgi:8-oxo-dGTP pyrophosphatase MutT (NUDIX family)